MSSHTIANSSPPKRATVSLARSSPSSRGPIAFSSSSPAWWPSESLITLRLSRSTNSRATRRASARGAGERVVQAVEQERAVGKAGEAVVQRVVAHLALRAHALYRAGEDVRDGLQEVEVAFVERALAAAVGGQHAECRVGAPDQHIGARDHPVLAQRTGAEVVVVRHVVDQDRTARVARVAVGPAERIHLEARADEAVVPAAARPDVHDALAEVLHDRHQLDVQCLRHRGDGGLEQGPEVVALQRGLAEARHRRLLGQAPRELGGRRAAIADPARRALHFVADAASAGL